MASPLPFDQRAQAAVVMNALAEDVDQLRDVLRAYQGLRSAIAGRQISAEIAVRFNALRRAMDMPALTPVDLQGQTTFARLLRRYEQRRVDRSDGRHTLYHRVGSRLLESATVGVFGPAGPEAIVSELAGRIDEALLAHNSNRRFRHSIEMLYEQIQLAAPRDIGDLRGLQTEILDLLARPTAGFQFPRLGTRLLGPLLAVLTTPFQARLGGVPISARYGLREVEERVRQNVRSAIATTALVVSVLRGSPLIQRQHSIVANIVLRQKNVVHDMGSRLLQRVYDGMNRRIEKGDQRRAVRSERRDRRAQMPIGSQIRDSTVRTVAMVAALATLAVSLIVAVRNTNDTLNQVNDGKDGTPGTSLASAQNDVEQAPAIDVVPTVQQPLLDALGSGGMQRLFADNPEVDQARIVDLVDDLGVAGNEVAENLEARDLLAVSPREGANRTSAFVLDFAAGAVLQVANNPAAIADAQDAARYAEVNSGGPVVTPAHAMNTSEAAAAGQAARANALQGLLGL